MCLTFHAGLSSKREFLGLVSAVCLLSSLLAGSFQRDKSDGTDLASYLLALVHAERASEGSSGLTIDDLAVEVV